MKEYLKNIQYISSKEYFNSHYPNRCFVCKKKINKQSELHIKKHLNFIYPCCTHCLHIENNTKKVFRKKIERFLHSELKYDLKKDIGYLRTIPKEKRGYKITSLIKKEFKEQNPPGWWINRETKKVCNYLNLIGDL